MAASDNTPVLTRSAVQMTEDWKTEIFDIYARMRGRPTPCEVVLAGLNLKVLEDVYAPDFFTDSAWFAQELATSMTSTSVMAAHNLLRRCTALRAYTNPGNGGLVASAFRCDGCDISQFSS